MEHVQADHISRLHYKWSEVTRNSDDLCSQTASLGHGEFCRPEASAANDQHWQVNQSEVISGAFKAS